MLLHPNKAGADSKAAFQQLHESYVKLREHLNSVHAPNPSVNDFFNDNFECFNFPCENKGSFTVKIENTLASAWNECLSQIFGSPQIKTNLKGTETDRYWKIDYDYQHETLEITLHLYMNPKNKKGSKLLVQGGLQAGICAYALMNFPSFTRRYATTRKMPLRINVMKVS